MPWCDSCDAYLAPNSVKVDGSCPTCSSEVDSSDAGNLTTTKVPWHFWVVLVALVAYLGWRLIVGIAWLLERA
ncbi:MAG: hypothetical protein ACR2QK_05160 [Acidimicrobiales bacterium]